MTQVAHLNWAYLRAPWGDPAVDGFVNNVDQVNRVGQRAPGFVRRPHLNDNKIAALLSDLVQVSDGPVDPNCLAVTLSVWRSPEALRQFVEKSIHGRFMRRRAEWFVPQGVPTYVIWPVPEDHVPSLAEAKERMLRLTRHGPSEEAYDFKWLEARAA